MSNIVNLWMHERTLVQGSSVLNSTLHTTRLKDMDFIPGFGGLAVRCMPCYASYDTKFGFGSWFSLVESHSGFGCRDMKPNQNEI